MTLAIMTRPTHAKLMPSTANSSASARGAEQPGRLPLSGRESARKTVRNIPYVSPARLRSTLHAQGPVASQPTRSQRSLCANGYSVGSGRREDGAERAPQHSDFAPPPRPAAGLFPALGPERLAQEWPLRNSAAPSAGERGAALRTSRALHSAGSTSTASLSLSLGRSPTWKAAAARAPFAPANIIRLAPPFSVQIAHVKLMLHYQTTKCKARQKPNTVAPSLVRGEKIKKQ